MSSQGLITIMAVLVFAFAGRAAFQWFRNRNGEPGWKRLQGTVVATRLGESGAGTAKTYFPIISVKYVVNGKAWIADDIAVTAQTNADPASVQARLEGPFAIGATVMLAHDPNAVERVMVAG